VLNIKIQNKAGYNLVNVLDWEFMVRAQSYCFQYMSETTPLKE